MPMLKTIVPASEVALVLDWNKEYVVLYSEVLNKRCLLLAFEAARFDFS
jgi:hypothetical protein